MSFSIELQEMLKQKTGYRNWGFRGSGVYEAAEVISFECEELGNTDVYEFVQQHYGVKLGSLAELLQWLDDRTAEWGKCYVLWLTSWEGVIKHYTYEGEQNVICKVTLPDDVFPLSDCGDQGTLFAMPIHPDWLQVEEEIYCK